jgi:Na+/melibiose symporter-like transporter
MFQLLRARRCRQSHRSSTVPGIALLLGFVACWFYPITKKRYRTILRKLELRWMRSARDNTSEAERKESAVRE